MYMTTSLSICMYMYVWLPMCTYLPIYVCIIMYVYTYCVFIYKYITTYMSSSLPMCIPYLSMVVLLCICTYILCIYIQIHKNIYKLMNHTYISIGLSICIQTCIHPCTYLHLQIHTYTYVRIYSDLQNKWGPRNGFQRFLLAEYYWETVIKRKLKPTINHHVNQSALCMASNSARASFLSFTTYKYRIVRTSSESVTEACYFDYTSICVTSLLTHIQ